MLHVSWAETGCVIFWAIIQKTKKKRFISLIQTLNVSVKSHADDFLAKLY